MSFTNKQEQNEVGLLRYASDLRQVGGLLMVTGLCAIVQPIGNVVGRIMPDGGTVTDGLAFSSLFGSLCLMAIGFMSIFVGYNQMIHDGGNKYLTIALIALTQTAFIPYLTDMSSIGMAAAAEGSQAFYNGFSEVSSMDVKFVGAMGIMGVMAYGFTFVGSISFMQFSLHAYQAGRPQDREASYYRGRMLFSCGMLLLAGIVQMLLGAYLLGNFATGAGGRFAGGGFVAVAMFTVNVPAISVFIGFIQILNALWGLARSCKMLGGEERDQVSWFQASIYAGWFLQILFQGVVQIGINGAIPAAAGLVGVSFGLNIMPAFLDYKSRSAPEEITPEYYGLTMTAHDDADDKEPTKSDEREEAV